MLSKKFVRRSTLLAAAAAAVPMIGSIGSAQADINIDSSQLTLVASSPIGKKLQMPHGGEADSGAVYSNVDTSINTEGYSSGTFSTTAGNSISGLIADDIHTAASVPGGLINRFYFSYANFNTDAVSVRPRVRFYMADGTTSSNGTPGPGTVISGFTFGASTFNANSYGVFYTDLPQASQFNIPTGATIWAGITYDNNGGTTGATGAQLANMGQIVFNPPTVGSSTTVDFESDVPNDSAHSFFGSNQSGTFFTASDGTPLNFAWEFVGPTAVEAPTEWAIDGSGTWEVGGNWTTGLYPTGVRSSATFGVAISSPSTITIAGATGAGTLIFDNTNSYTIAGGQLIVGGGGLATINVNSGSHFIRSSASLDNSTITIAANAQLTAFNWNDGSTTLSKGGAGTLIINRTQADNVNLNGGQIKLIAGSAVSTIGTLTVAGTLAAPTAKLDVTDNDVIFHAGTAKATVESLVKTARASGAWTGNGITTSLAVPTVVGLVKPTGLAVVSGAEYISVRASNTAFDGVAVVATDTLVKYTWNGDANLDGKIDANDYAKIDAGFQNQSQSGFVRDYFNGNFDYNNIIDANDYALIDAAFVTQSGVLRPAIDWLEGNGGSLTSDQLNSAAIRAVIGHYDEFGGAYANAFLQNNVPEPTTLGVIGVASAGLLARRRRRSM